ncbi:MAG: mechanosensitive ion channel family protein [Kofleriaceae bacterium]
MSVTQEDLSRIANEYLAPFGLRVLLALAIFVLGRMLARLLLGGMDRVMVRSQLDVSLRKFLRDVVYAIALVAVVIASLDALGIQTTAVVAVLGAAGLAIGLSLQGSLSNFAAGVMLITMRPYKVDDLVAIGKYTGRVEAIRVFHTILVTGDHREVTIPNGQIIIAPIENLTVLGRRRVDLLVTVKQPADLTRARELIEQVIRADNRIEHPETTTINIAEISDVEIKFHVRPWTSVEHYVHVSTDAMAHMKDTMEAAGLKYAVALQA